MAQTPANKLITYTELAKHNSKENCWIAVEGRVLDVTEHLNQYTSDQGFLLKNAGTDATYQFTLKEKEGGSGYANALIDKFCIGSLDYNSEKVAPKEGTKDLQRMYTFLEISKHNSPEDCWVIVDNRVCDMTKFLDEHPGGAALILDYGGMDCTKQYVDNNHSQYATKTLIENQLGVVDLNSRQEFLSLKAKQARRSYLIVGGAVTILLCNLIIYMLFFR